MGKYTIVYEGKDDNITIYDTPSCFMFTTTYEGKELTRCIAKGSMALEEILSAKYDIEYDLINLNR